MFAADISPKCCGTYKCDRRTRTRVTRVRRGHACRNAWTNFDAIMRIDATRRYDFNKDSASRIRRRRDAIALMMARPSAVQFSLLLIGRGYNFPTKNYSGLIAITIIQVRIRFKSLIFFITVAIVIKNYSEAYRNNQG